MATVSPPAAVPAGERGATRIADRVVAKIAAQAAREALLRESPRARTDAHATVTVHRHEERRNFGEARVRIAVELGYPSDIGAQSRVVRRHVTEQVQELANMAVPEVAVEVERLHSPQLDRTDRGRVR
ncbi:Asp23/Gls24 family envelope stress response protein [Streptomyces sioyaensis]|uniref:Asp23/Gls24 family envelope stress response protein n=1 Tax=Streptomyces sioyaensis TaxID=67364 RepID=A0A4Q1QX91_9ACTN|nr:Asp23/Gls24 family envelope stress response protein [Streptomyces sioyaensis]MBM4790974.1 Asp23/Gls24 family envelope stress response protein [Streptomyces sioyaensis]RXS60215.1 Asp23/Gls24 family envelope stress response protein [Streptomyces sioyaensis]